MDVFARGVKKFLRVTPIAVHDPKLEVVVAGFIMENNIPIVR
jgi:hypothetical protein